MFTIESTVPTPATKGRRSLYPFRDMKIGDSFFVSDDTDSGSVRCAASYFAIRNKGYRFTVQKVANGVRVWRIAK